MSSTVFVRKPAQPVVFQSAREACRHLLQNARTGTGRLMPLAVPEIAAQLSSLGFTISHRDIEGFLRELAFFGEVVEIDAHAGFRWIEPAA